MWLSSLLLLLVASTAVHGSDCLVKSLKCSRFRPALNTHKDLFVSRTQMNEMCRQQDRFFKCLDHMVASMAMGEAGLPAPLQHARTLIKDLCLTTSFWQKKYFELASCINRQYTELCTHPEFLGTVGLGDEPRSKCSFREEAVNCIAATLAMNCGMDAGKLFHHLLRMTSDGVKNCYSVGSEILFLPTHEARDDENAEAYTEVYSSLVKRIGSIPEQDEAVEVLAEDNDIISEREDIGRDTLEEFSSSVPTSEECSMPCSTPYTIAQTEEELYLPPGLYEEVKATLDHKIFQYAIRFPTNSSISEYTRNPFFNIMEFMYCHKLVKDGVKKIFCYYVLRDTIPVCLEGGEIRRPLDDPIDPENIDPELGARLYAMFPYSYHFRPYEEMSDRMFKRIRESRKAYFGKTTEESVWATDSPLNTDGYYTSMYEAYTKDSSVAPEFDSSDSEFSNDKDRKKRNSEYESYSTQFPKESVAGDLVRNYAMAMTTSRPQRDDDETVGGFVETTTTITTGFDGMKVNIPRFTAQHRRLLGLMEDVDWLFARKVRSPRSRVKWLTPHIAQIIIDEKENFRLVNVTCARVNECHPNSTDIHKCQYYFDLDDKESTEEPEMQADDSNSREPTIDGELDTHTYDKSVSPSEETSGGLGNVEPEVVFDESYGHLDIPATEAELEHASFYQTPEETLETSEDDTEPIHFVLLEPGALDAVPSLRSDETPQVELTVESVDSEHNSSENGDPIPEDEYPVSDSSVVVDESLRQELDFIQSLNDLEAMIADGLANIQEE